MAAYDIKNKGKAISQQPITLLIQIWCIIPHSRGQGSQWRLDITDRRHGLQDTRFIGLPRWPAMKFMMYKWLYFINQIPQ